MILMHRHTHKRYLNCPAGRSSRVRLVDDRFCQLKFPDRGSMKYIASVYI